MIFQCVYGVFILIFMLDWLQLSLELVYLCLKFVYFLGFLAHPPPIDWFASQGSLTLKSLLYQDIFHKSLLVLQCEIVFISVEPYWWFEKCFTSIVKHRSQIVCFGWTERSCLWSFFVSESESVYHLSIFETFLAFKIIKWKIFSCWVNFLHFHLLFALIELMRKEIIIAF